MKIDWTPTEKESPNKNGSYLVTRQLQNGVTYIDVLLYATDLGKLFDKKYKGKSGWFVDNYEPHYILRDETILAWADVKPYDKKESEKLGIGYFIRYKVQIQVPNCSQKEFNYYGKGLQSVGWTNSGYQTIEKAKAAIKRLEKLNREEGNTTDYEYTVVNEYGEEVENNGN